MRSRPAVTVNDTVKKHRTGSSSASSVGPLEVTLVIARCTFYRRSAHRCFGRYRNRWFAAKSYNLCYCRNSRDIRQPRGCVRWCWTWPFVHWRTRKKSQSCGCIRFRSSIPRMRWTFKQRRQRRLLLAGSSTDWRRKGPRLFTQILSSFHLEIRS